MSEGGRTQRPELDIPKAAGDSKEQAQEKTSVAATAASNRFDPSPAARFQRVTAQREAVGVDLHRRAKLHRASTGAAPRGGAAVPRTTGAPLAGPIRERMESQLGADLSEARVHTGGDSANTANAAGAKAFTVGKDIHFGAGQFSPGSKEGDRLLAHELTHVVQGNKSGGSGALHRKAEPDADHDEDLEISESHEASEQEADAVADRAADALHGGGKPTDDKKPKEISAPLAQSKLHAKKKTTTQPMKAQPAPAKGKPKQKTAPMPGKPPPQPQVDALTEFRQRLLLSHPLSETYFTKLTPQEKQQLTNLELRQGLELSPTLGIHMMQAKGQTFQTQPSLCDVILNSPNPGAYYQPLVNAGLLDLFLLLNPRRGQVSNKQAQALQAFMRGAAHSRQVFEKVYPTLKDATYDASILWSVPWGEAEIKRFYGSLVKWAPVAHVQASSSGFYLGTHHKLGSTTWQPLGFAWQHGAHMVIPQVSAGNAAEGGKGHDMTGGQNASAQGKGAQGGPGAQTTHLEGSALHEVGHAVANHVGGNAWAEKRNGWEKVAMNKWSKALFNDDVDKQFRSGWWIFSSVDKNAVSGEDARLFMASAISGATHTVKGKSAAQVQAFIVAYYGAEPLSQYYFAKLSGADDYRIPPTNVRGGKAYAYHSRYGNSFCTYNAQTYQNRVSWYSVSSPMEWFAENYAHYYRMQGKGLDDDVKKKLDEIDKMKMNYTEPGPHGAGQLKKGAGAGVGAENNAGDADKAPPAQHKEVKRMPYQW